jgi:hypothetical protein
MHDERRRTKTSRHTGAHSRARCDNLRCRCQQSFGWRSDVIRSCVRNHRSQAGQLPDRPTPMSREASLREAPKARHYSYRVDHDLGFAPHIEGRVCTVCGCKKTTIEQWAKAGSWIVGIGGKNTGKFNALIYAMKVEQILSYKEFKRGHPSRASYLSGLAISPEAPVLVSTHFYYFGDHAQPLPPELSHIIHTTQGCKRLSDFDISLLNNLILSGYRRGALGKPNNRHLKS